MARRSLCRKPIGFVDFFGARRRLRPSRLSRVKATLSIDKPAPRRSRVSARVAPRPNILYLHSHDTGRWVQPYGYPVPTPNIQRLADQGPGAEERPAGKG